LKMLRLNAYNYLKRLTAGNRSILGLLPAEKVPRGRELAI